MDTYLGILADAIADVGRWCWWDEHFPEFFQVEFGGTQLWNPPLEDGQAPSGTIALRFEQPRSVSFLTSKVYLEHWGPEWPRQLHDDLLDPLGLGRSKESFTFEVEGQIRNMIEESGRIDTILGFPPSAEAFLSVPSKLAFWAGPVGLITGAERMKVLNHHGDLAPPQIGPMNKKWWEYWKEYWRLKDTANALPYDYACEVTIPGGS